MNETRAKIFIILQIKLKISFQANIQIIRKTKKNNISLTHLNNRIRLFPLNTCIETKFKIILSLYQNKSMRNIHTSLSEFLNLEIILTSSI
jgi:hypothetical protein